MAPGRLEVLDMTDIKYLDEAARLAGFKDWAEAQYMCLTPAVTRSIHAHAATLEREANFRQEVSDAVKAFIAQTNSDCSTLWAGVTRDALSRFILPTSDPIETALSELGIDRGELARRGVKLVEVE